MSTFRRFCAEHRVQATANPERPSLTKDEKGWEHYAYEVTLQYQGRTLVTPFKCGSGHSRIDIYKRRVPVPPNAADVLASLISDSYALEQSFEDWAGDFGYDTDSRKALETYLLCQKFGRQVRALLGDGFQAFAEASREH